MSDGTVLSEEQLRAVVATTGQFGEPTPDEIAICRAVERAVLELANWERDVWHDSHKQAGLPPLDAALVEECARAWATARGSIQDGIAAALQHYRERVEGPLREELRAAHETARKWLDGLESAERNVAHFRAESDRLRGELAAAEQRRLNDIAMLTAAHNVARSPQPTDAERQRLIKWLRAQRWWGPDEPKAERIATLLEAPTRKSVGRRWASLNPDGSIEYTAPEPQYGRREVLCDLVPVEEES